MSWSDVLPYGIFTDDNNGFRHSIDKLIINYEAISPLFSFDAFSLEFSSLSSFSFCSERGEEGYNSFFHKKPSSSYSWFSSAFWFPHCNVKFGLFEYRASDKLWIECPRLRVEFNPNKIFSDDRLTILFLLIRKYFKCGTLLECDYSVDLPCPTSQILSKSRKDKIVYNDSRYYGKRHSPGRLKIYNKRREVLNKEKISLDCDLTRCEVTFVCNKAMSFDGAFLCSGVTDSKLSPNLRAIADLIALASSYGEDKEELIKRFVPDKRNRDKLVPVLFGDCHMVFNFAIFTEILKKYAGIYNFTHTFYIGGVSDA